MTSTAIMKKDVLEIELDEHRLRGSWLSARDTSGKYRKRCSSSGYAVILDLLVNGETTLNLIPGWTNYASAFPYDSGPTVVVTPSPNVSPIATEEASDMLKQAIAQSSNMSGVDRLVFQSCTLLARIDLANGKPNDALNRLKSVTMPDESEILSSKDQSYIPVATMMYWVVYAWVHQSLENHEQALFCLSKAVDIADKTMDDYAQVFPLAPDGLPDQWTFWAEEALYGFTNAVLRAGEHARLRRPLFLYVKSILHTPITYQPTKKIAILFQYLSLLSQESVAAIGTPYSGLFEKKLDLSGKDNQALIRENINSIRSVILLYEKLVTSQLPFPKGDESSSLLFQRHERVKLAYDWWVLAQAYSTTPEAEALEEFQQRHRTLIQALYRGTKHAFQSLKILRFLCHSYLHFILKGGDSIPACDRDEMIHLVETYFYFWERRSNLYVEMERKRRRDISLGKVTPSVEDRVPAMRRHSPVAFQQEEKRSNKKPNADEVTWLEDIKISKIDQETISDVVGVLLIGVEAILRDPRIDAEKLKKATRFGENAHDILINHGKDLKDFEKIYSTLSYWLGILYNEMALEVSHDESQDFQQKSLAMFKRATEDSFFALDAKYNLALQFCQVKEFDFAVAVVKELVQFRPTDPLSFNLLAVILSLHGNDDGALTVIHQGWKLCILSLSIKSKSGHDFNPERDVIWKNVPIQFKLDLVNLKLTQIAVETRHMGMTIALESIQELFRCFSFFFDVIHSNEKNSESLFKFRSKDGDFSWSEYFGESQFIAAYELLIRMWLTASSIFRGLFELDNSRSALAEAQHLLLQLSEMEGAYRDMESQIFRTESTPATNSVAITIGTTHSKSASSLQKSFRIKRTNSTGDVTQVPTRFGIASTFVRKLLADVTFEESLLMYDVVLAKSKKHDIKNKDRHSRSVTSNSKHILGSLASLALQDNIVADGIPHSRASSAVYNVDQTAQSPVLHLDYISIFEPATAEIPEMQSQGIGCSERNNVGEDSAGTIIPWLQSVLTYDPQHLSSKVLLGIIYYTLQDKQMAEHWLEKACMDNNLRGSMFRAVYTSSHHGGTTSWASAGWEFLGRLMNDTDRLKGSYQSYMFAASTMRKSNVLPFEAFQHPIRI